MATSKQRLIEGNTETRLDFEHFCWNDWCAVAGGKLSAGIASMVFPLIRHSTGKHGLGNETFPQGDSYLNW